MSGIVECRTYMLRPGTLNPFFDLYEQKGFPVQRRHLGDPVGYYYTEIGPLNQIVHMWAYASFEERTRKRKNLINDPAWIAYLHEAAKEDAVVTQETKIFLRAPFFEPLFNPKEE